MSESNRPPAPGFVRKVRRQHHDVASLEELRRERRLAEAQLDLEARPQSDPPEAA